MEFVRFSNTNEKQFQALLEVFEHIKAVKNQDFDDSLDSEDCEDYDLELLYRTVPQKVKENFDWNNVDKNRDKPVKILPPGTYLGERWAFKNILDNIDESDYMLEEIKRTKVNEAELHIRACGYPYGGLNPLIALIEGFGFRVIGFNECGKYESVST